MEAFRPKWGIARSVRVPFCPHMTRAYPVQLASTCPTVSWSSVERNILIDELPRPEDLICGEAAEYMTIPVENQTPSDGIS
jgi:hypothetical protein